MFIPLLPNLFKWQVNVISYGLCTLFWNNMVWMVGYDGRLTVWKYNIWKYKWQKSLQIGNFNINTIVIYNLKSTKVITNWKYNVTQSLHLTKIQTKIHITTPATILCVLSHSFHTITQIRKKSMTILSITSSTFAFFDAFSLYFAYYSLQSPIQE